MHRTCCFTYLYLQYVTSSRSPLTFSLPDLNITVSATPSVGHLANFSAVFRTNVRKDSWNGSTVASNHQHGQERTFHRNKNSKMSLEPNVRTSPKLRDMSDNWSETRHYKPLESHSRWYPVLWERHGRCANRPMAKPFVTPMSLTQKWARTRRMSGELLYPCVQEKNI